MTQKEEFFVKVRTKKKNEEVFTYKKIDIFEIHDQDGVSLGQHIETLKNNYEILRDEFDSLKDDYIKTKVGLVQR